jgi:hypothetical protein
MKTETLISSKANKGYGKSSSAMHKIRAKRAEMLLDGRWHIAEEDCMSLIT